MKTSIETARCNREGSRRAWLQYFLNGVARQAEDALSRAERINGLLTKWREAVSGTASKTPLAMVDMLAANPYLTIKRAAKQLDVAFTTAQRAVGKLESLAIVKEISKGKRDRVYCATAILNIFEEPARLEGWDAG